MTIQYADAVMADRMTAVKNRIDAGTGTACIKLYTSPRPATGAAPTGATLLATINLDSPCGAVVNGDLELAVVTPVSIAASGAHAWGRILDRDGNFVGDGSTGLPDSAADIRVAASMLYVGGNLNIASAYLRDR